MRDWLVFLLVVGLLRGSALAHCICHDEDYGSFSLEFSEEVSLGGDLSDFPFTIHHHDHGHDHDHHDHDHDNSVDFGDFLGSDLFGSDEDHGSFLEDFSEELELEVDDHDHDHSYDHHDHDHSYEHHHHDYDHDYSHETDFYPDENNYQFYYRK